MACMVTVLAEYKELKFGPGDAEEREYGWGDGVALPLLPSHTGAWWFRLRCRHLSSHFLSCCPRLVGPQAVSTVTSASHTDRGLCTCRYAVGGSSATYPTRAWYISSGRRLLYKFPVVRSSSCSIFQLFKLRVHIYASTQVTTQLDWISPFLNLTTTTSAPRQPWKTGLCDCTCAECDGTELDAGNVCTTGRLSWTRPGFAHVRVVNVPSQMARRTNALTIHGTT